MASDNHGCSLELQGPNGERVELVTLEVEGPFLGLRLTEREGLNMRRVGAELRDPEHIRALRDSLTAYLERNGF